MDSIDPIKEIVSKLGAPELKKLLKMSHRSCQGKVAVLRSRVMRLTESSNPDEILNNISNLSSVIRADSTTRAGTTRSRSRTRNRTSIEDWGSDTVDICDIPPVPSQVPVHPDVRFKSLPFLEVLGELLKPTSLAVQARSGTSDSNHPFYLTPAQAAQIRSGTTHKNSLNSETNKQYTVQILVRFGLLETTSAQDDCYPPGLRVWVNHQSYTLPNVTSSHSEDQKRGHQPLNVTSLAWVDPMKSNCVQVSYIPHFQRYVIGIFLVKKASCETLLGRLRGKGPRVAYYTKGMIQQKLKDDQDMEIATTCLRVSLVCPLGKMRLQTPCRATTCDHLQCFDAAVFLQMMEKTPAWLCPVCVKPALFENLVIDEYFVDVLSSDKLPTNCCEIQLMADGGWRPMGTQKDASSSSKVMKCSEVRLPSSSDDECEVLEVKVDSRKAPRRPRSPQVHTVDLVSNSPSPVPSASSNDSQAILPFKKRKTNAILDDVLSLPGSPIVIELIDSDSAPESYTNKPFVPEPMSSRTPSSAEISATESVDSPASYKPRRRKKQRRPTRVSRSPKRRSLRKACSSPSESPRVNLMDFVYNPSRSPDLQLDDHPAAALAKWHLSAFGMSSSSKKSPPPVIIEDTRDSVSYAVTKSSATTLVISKRKSIFSPVDFERSPNCSDKTESPSMVEKRVEDDEIVEKNKDPNHTISHLLRNEESPVPSSNSLSYSQDAKINQTAFDGQGALNASVPSQLDLIETEINELQERNEAIQSIIHFLVSSAVEGRKEGEDDRASAPNHREHFMQGIDEIDPSVETYCPEVERLLCHEIFEDTPAMVPNDNEPVSIISGVVNSSIPTVIKSGLISNKSHTSPVVVSELANAHIVQSDEEVSESMDELNTENPASINEVTFFEHSSTTLESALDFSKTSFKPVDMRRNPSAQRTESDESIPGPSFRPSRYSKPEVSSELQRYLNQPSPFRPSILKRHKRPACPPSVLEQSLPLSRRNRHKKETIHVTPTQSSERNEENGSLISDERPNHSVSSSADVRILIDKLIAPPSSSSSDDNTDYLPSSSSVKRDKRYRNVRPSAAGIYEEHPQYFVTSTAEERAGSSGRPNATQILNHEELLLSNSYRGVDLSATRDSEAPIMTSTEHLSGLNLSRRHSNESDDSETQPTSSRYGNQSGISPNFYLPAILRKSSFARAKKPQ